MSRFASDTRGRDMTSLNEWQATITRLESAINALEGIVIEYPDGSIIRVSEPSELPTLQGTVITHGTYSAYLLRENGVWVSACTCGDLNGVYTAEEFFEHLLTLDPCQPFKVIHS